MAGWESFACPGVGLVATVKANGQGDHDHEHYGEQAGGRVEEVEEAEKMAVEVVAVGGAVWRER